MQNLYEIDVPFGQLDRETQIALMVAIVLDKKPWQFRNPLQIELSQPAFGSCNFIDQIIYRLFSEPETMDTIPWDDMAPDLVCAFVEINGVPYASSSFEPDTKRIAVRLDAFARYKRGTVAPERSLQYRPGCKPNLTNKTE